MSKNSLNRLIRCVCGKKIGQIREILISESAWEEMTCLFAPSLDEIVNQLMIEYADRLATESEKEISNKKEIAKAELLKQLLEI